MPAPKNWFDVGFYQRLAGQGYHVVEGVVTPIEESKMGHYEPSKSVADLEYSVNTKYMIGNRVVIDGCHNLVGVITAITWRHKDIINYEVSWVDHGKAESHIIEGWRLGRAL